MIKLKAHGERNNVQNQSRARYLFSDVGVSAAASTLVDDAARWPWLFSFYVCLNTANHAHILSFDS